MFEGKELGDNELKWELFNVDDAILEVYNGKDGDTVGWIKLVFGNDGYDLISDYSTSLEKFLAPVNELAEFWGGWIDNG